MNRLTAIFLICLTTYIVAEEAPPSRAENLAAVDKTYRENLKKYRGSDDFMVRKGMLADRKNKIIRLQAEACGVQAREIAEFFIINQTSGHAYEAIAVAFCNPGDVKDALEYFGMKPGRGIDVRRQMIWPKGERVIVHIDGVRAEKFVYDDKRDRGLPLSGFVFTGSRMMTNPDKPGEVKIAADLREPGSIASNYNENESVLDVPRSAPQRSVYGNNLVVEEHVLPKGKFIEITIEPEYKDGKKRVVDLQVQIQRDKGQGTRDKVDCVVDEKSYSMEELLQYLREYLKNGQDPFVTLDFDDALPLAAAKSFSKALTLLDTDDGIRLEPPLEGQLYHRAFNPPAHFLDRSKRIQHPLELFLEKKDGVISGTLRQYKTSWIEGTADTKLTEKAFPVTDPASLREAMDKIESELIVLFVHAPGTFTHAELMTYVTPAMTTHPVIQVFVAD